MIAAYCISSYVIMYTVFRILKKRNRFNEKGYCKEDKIIVSLGLIFSPITLLILFSFVLYFAVPRYLEKIGEWLLR